MMTKPSAFVVNGSRLNTCYFLFGLCSVSSLFQQEVLQLDEY